ncbi:MAG: DUF6886 family protein [Gaiellaceae bacterium]
MTDPLPDALWHVSEDPSIDVFVPHHRPEHANDEPLVYAVDTWHMPFYWFPRDCPRAAWWARDDTTDEDVDDWLDGDRTRRVSAIESSWLDRMRTVRLFAYRLPEETFEPWDKFFVSRDTVAPLDLVELGDLLGRHVDAGIELRVVPVLYPLWDRVIRTTLEYSGIRLRNAVHP